MQFPFDNSYHRDLEGLYLKALPTAVYDPKLIRFNHGLAHELGLNAEKASDAELANLFSGNALPEGAQPLGMAYAGHQFGHFSPQLGDGRAILLGEVIDKSGKRCDIQLKGAGPTPFSRRGDGRSALGPVLREYIISEAMFALGIPATRALACVLTGEEVMRETLVPGGIFTRVAASHIRVGTFQFFASRSDRASVKRLADYALQRHYPELATAQRPALSLLQAVISAQASLIAKWMAVGFVHGVMNTDNCAISGETIDFGPCAFVDHYDPHALFSSIDRDGRYAFSNQANIAQWNMARLAEALVPLIAEDEHQAVALANEALAEFSVHFEQSYAHEMGRKFGLTSTRQGDEKLTGQLLGLMQLEVVDYTVAFRSLSNVEDGGQSFIGLFNDKHQIGNWYEAWKARLTSEHADARLAAKALRSANPAIIPRNHRIEEVIRAASDHGDFAPFHGLVDILAKPYEDQPHDVIYRLPPREGERVTKTFCGT